MTPEVVGSTMLHACADEVFSTAYLRAGAGNSGKLVAAVKRNLTESAENLDEHAAALSPFAVIDGSPGIGCPVIASLAKVDMVLIVAEPSASGISDVERLLEVVERLRVKVALCVNKADIDPNSTQRLRELCETIGIPFAGAIPYDHAMAKSVSEGRSTWEGPAYEAVRGVYECVMELLAPDCPLPRSASSAAVDSSAAAARPAVDGSAADARPAVDSSAASADQAQGE